MPCCSSSCGCGTDTSIPWFTALRDPAMLRLILARYRRELLTGLTAGALAGTALTFLEPLGALGPALGAPWLHVHGAAALPALLLAGPALFLALAGRGRQAWRTGAGWTLAFLVLGGLVNGMLEAADPLRLSAFVLDGGYASPVVFGCLGLLALWILWEAAAALGLRPIPNKDLQ